MSGLALLQQADFSKGVYRNPAPELIPKDGVADALNALLEEDGSIYRRGGSVAKTPLTAVGQQLIFLWDGWTAGGPRTLAAGRFDLLQPFWAIDPATDNTLVNLGGLGTMNDRAASGNGLVYIPAGLTALGQISMWGGSVKTANYTTGTITTALLSRTVTGVGTSFVANVDPGMILVGPGATYVGAVASVDSNTQLTLHDFAQTALSASAYTLTPIQVITPVAVPSGQQVFVGTVGDPARLLVGYRNQVKFSAAGNPMSFAATDYHQVPEGQIIGLAGLQDQAFVFTTAGIYVISNMNFNLIDAFGNPQQRLSQLTKDVILLDARGIAGYRNQLIVPGTDDIWQLGPTQYPVAISDPIRTLYRTYVQGARVCGNAAVYRNHYVMPVLDATFGWIDTLVNRLDQGGWTRWQPGNMKTIAFATRSTSPTRKPALLSVANGAGGTQSRVHDFSTAWTPGSSVATDGDGQTFAFQVTTRDYATGVAATHNLVKKIRVRYELIDTGAGFNPVLTAQFGTGVSGAGAQWGTGTWGSFVWGDLNNPGFIPIKGSANNGDAPPDSGVNPFVWAVPQQAPAFFRLRFTCIQPVARLTLREIDSFVRTRSRQ